MVTISSDGNAPESTANNISGVIQTVLAAQLVGRSGILDGGDGVPVGDGNGRIGAAI